MQSTVSYGSVSKCKSMQDDSKTNKVTACSHFSLYRSAACRCEYHLSSFRLRPWKKCALPIRLKGWRTENTRLYARKSIPRYANLINVICPTSSWAFGIFNSTPSVHPTVQLSNCWTCKGINCMEMPVWFSCLLKNEPFTNWRPVEWKLNGPTFLCLLHTV